MNNPEFIKIDDKKYKINTDFRVAIRCNEISSSDEIGPYEKALAIIYLLFGDEGLNDTDNYEKLLELAIKYLNCGREKTETDEKPDMDFVQDERLIASSFKFDYGYDPYKEEYIHWWDFYNDLSNLSNSELGSCCVLNRIRNLRTFDVSQIKDSKTREKIIKAKEQVALKEKARAKTDEEIKMDKLWEKQIRKGGGQG